jgi:6-phospho-beta-glucosidase
MQDFPLARTVQIWFNRSMKLTLIGAGGFRTPVIYRALASGEVTTRYDEVAFYDIDQSRLDRIGGVLDGIAEELGTTAPVTMTTDLEAAVDGADVVYCAVRVGGMAGRILDETSALGEGVIGQETTGPGGITFALRTVPVVMSIAEVVARRAPNATFVNFTNPVGLVTEAVRRVLGDRVVGICDAPLDLCKRVAGALGRPVEELWFDYFGINHLGWVRGVLDGGRDVLPGLLEDRERLEKFEEGRLFGADWIRAVGMIPNEYLYYYYFNAEALEAMQAGRVRSAFLERQQAAFYAGQGSPAEALRDWHRTHAERESHYMEEAWSGREDAMAGIVAARGPGDYGTLALNLVDGLHGEGYHVMILDVPNRSSLPFLDEEAIVEVPCIVSKGGVVPAAIGTVPLHAQGLILSVRAAERAAVEAALSGSRTLAIKALAMHPLVPSVEVATRILDGYIAGQPILVERYGAA